jgi:serine/threonine-protein kinase
MSISKLLFGEIALKKKLVTKEQVEECLEIQRKLKDMGITKTLGAVMHDKKYLSMVEIKEILREMTGTKEWNAIEGYEILGKLGKGGMGSVYKARHQKLDKLVALKVLPPELASNQEYLDRFMREARAAAKLNHPNIVQALDVGESYGYHYFVMEYVEGRTVKDMIEQDGPLPEGRALDIVIQVSEALVHAWKHEMVHRDIKPSNIIVNEQGVAKLCDLGLAKSVSEDGTITQTGVIMGTPFYLSPEQARSEDLDCRSDIYSLGVTLFHMTTGQVPFTGNSAATILYKHIFLDPPKPKSLNPKISDGLSRLILRMMSKSRDDRPQTPTTLIGELRELVRELDEREGRDPDAPRVESTRSDAYDMPTATFERLGNSLVDSGPEPAGETGVLGISGPNVAVRGGDDTVGSSERTEPIQRESDDETISEPVPLLDRPAAPASRPRARRSVVLAASAAGLAALVGFVALQVAAPPPLPPPAGPEAAVRAVTLHLAPRPEVAEAVATAETLRRDGKIALAAHVLAAAAMPKPGAGPLAPADRAALAAGREALVADAARAFEAIDRQYEEFSKQPGQDVEPLLRRLHDLDLPALGRLVDAERAGLASARAALAARAGGGAPAPAPER